MTTREHEGRWIHRTVGVVGMLALALHFTLTIIYLHPISVVGLGTRDWVTSYMEPYFQQRWTLFAPDPPLDDRRLDYQCELDGEVGPWTSRSEGLLRTHARFRFGPAGRMRRHEQAAMSAVVGVHDSVIDEIIAAKGEASERQRELIDLRMAQQTALRIQGGMITYELVADYCREERGEPDAVRFRLVTRPIAPYSSRNDPSWSAEPEVFVSPWLAPADFASLDEQAQRYMRDYLARRGQDGEAAP